MSRRFWLVFALTVLLCAPAHAATVGIYANGYASHVGGDQGCIAPSVDLVIRNLEEPLKEIEFSLDVSEGFANYVSIYYVAGGTVTCEGNNVTIRFDNCVNPTEYFSVMLFMFWYGEDADQTICVRPPSPSVVDPPAVSYETCDGQHVPMEIAAVSYDNIPDGCLLVSKMVPAVQSTWGTLKTWY